MKKFYFLALFSCLGFSAFSQTIVTVYAHNVTPGAKVTGTASSSATFGYSFTAGDITTSADTIRGYAVFDLGPTGANIPSGATILSVTAGIDVSSYFPGANPGYNVFGYSGDLSTFTNPALYNNMAPPFTYLASPAGVLYTATFGAAVGDPLFPSTGNSVGFIQANVSVPTPGKVSLSYNTVATTTSQYVITGEEGNTTTGAGHAPYLTIVYCAVPSGVSAIANPDPVCEGTTLTLTGAAVNATNYTWTGPNGFTAATLTAAIPAVTPAAAGVYTLTVANVCGATVNSVVATTLTATVTPGPITGITNAWVDFTTLLSDPTPGGTWTSTNPTIATVGASTGIVTGVAPGNVTISYITPGGCIFYDTVLIVQSVFSQIPTITTDTIFGFPIVAWYPFCADTTDHSGSTTTGGHDLDRYILTPTSTALGYTTPPQLTTDRFGIPNDAYYYDGIADMMEWSTFFTISGPTSDYTYSCWFEADTLEDAVILFNGNLGTTSPAPPYTWSNGWGFVINDGAAWGSNTGPTGPYITAPGNYVSVLFGGEAQYLSTPVSLNRWHNLMLKKNGNSYNFYVDDVSAGFFISPFNGMSAASGSIFRLGLDSTGFKPFRGKIDDIAIYNRQLSNNERDSLYNFNPDARVFTLGNDTTICTDSITLFPTPPTIGNYYTWSTGSHDSAITVDPISSVGGNQYELAVGKPYGCLTVDTILVYKNPIPINVGPAVLNLCLGDTATLGDLFFPHTSFLWSTGDTAHSIQVYSTGVYSVVADSNICVGRDTVHVNVYPVPIIGLDSFQAHCQGMPDTIVVHFDSAYAYQWSTIGFPSFAFTDTLIDTSIGLHTFWVSVTDGFCTRSDTVQILIVFDTLTFTQGDVALCQGEDTLLSSATVTNNFIANYQWTPTTGISASNIYDPLIAPDTSAEYYLNVTYPGCPTITDSFYVDVQPNPRVFLGENRSACQDDTLHILSTVVPAWYTHYNYSWTPAGVLDSTTTPIVVFLDTNNIDTINLVLTVSTPHAAADLNGGCISRDSIQIVVHQSKYFYDSTYYYSMCPNDSVLLSDSILLNTGLVATYSWSPSTSLSDSTAQFPWAHAITTTDYKLTATSQYGCRDTLNEHVTVFPAAVMHMPDSVTLYPGEPYQISPLTNCVNFVWFPPLGLDNIYSSDPKATPDVRTVYIVNASTEHGCTITDSIIVHLDDGNYIAIPNAFTPGAGINKTFFVFKTGLVSLNYFRIFDRWGNKVFETNNIDAGWDGTFNGKPQPFGVYTYEVEAISITGGVYDRVGNVTLIR